MVDSNRIGKMVEDWQGNGKLLHNGENGLIAIYFFGIEQRWCGNGELLNNSLFFRDRATGSQWQTPPRWREWTDCNLFLRNRVMVWQWQTPQQFSITSQ
jgi:hypothetical protein